jgi:hypothetical protein
LIRVVQKVIKKYCSELYHPKNGQADIMKNEKQNISEPNIRNIIYILSLKIKVLFSK